jgi:hypothetical protein
MSTSSSDEKRLPPAMSEAIADRAVEALLKMITHLAGEQPGHAVAVSPFVMFPHHKNETDRSFVEIRQDLLGAKKEIQSRLDDGDDLVVVGVFGENGTYGWALGSGFEKPTTKLAEFIDSEMQAMAKVHAITCRTSSTGSPENQ